MEGMITRERGEGLLTPIRREICLLAVASLLVIALPFSASHNEASYEGVLAINHSLLVGGLYPAGKLQIYIQNPQVTSSSQGILLWSRPRLGRILIHCPGDVPSNLVLDPADFSDWIKANCELSPLWRP